MIVPIVPMLVNHSQFLVLVLMLVCLCANIFYFSDVRKQFFGENDPIESIEDSFAKLDYSQIELSKNSIKGKIADFFPKVQSNVEDISNTEPPVRNDSNRQKQEEEKREEIKQKEETTRKALSLPSAAAKASSSKKEEPAQKEQQTESIDETPVDSADNIVPVEQFMLPQAPQDETLEKITQDNKEQRNSESKTDSQMVAVMPVSATVQPAVAEQFKPLVDPPLIENPRKIPLSTRPSSAPVWDTIDSVMERPARNRW